MYGKAKLRRPLSLKGNGLHYLLSTAQHQRMCSRIRKSSYGNYPSVTDGPSTVRTCTIELSSPMVDVKTAVTTANAFLMDLYPTAREVRLEEVALNAIGTAWQAVLSFRMVESGQMAPLSSQGSRVFKQVDVDRISGEARALR